MEMRHLIRAALAMLFSLALIGLAPAAAQPKKFQRMVLSPGCYVLAPGASTDVSAYCLDPSRPAPAPGVNLASAPASLGSTTVRPDGGPAVTLQAALAGHLIALEGLGGGDYLHLRVSNLSGRKIELCVTSPTVVAGDDGYPTDDLRRIYHRIARILAAPDKNRSQSDQPDRARLQEQIWQTTEHAAEEELDRRLGPLSPPGGRPGVPGPSSGPPDCTRGSDTITVCAGR
jgi:hypothetical protein